MSGGPSPRPTTPTPRPAVGGQRETVPDRGAGHYPERVPDRNDHQPDQPASSTREHLTPDDVAKVAQLALLDLTDDERQRFASQLDAVLELADQLDGFDLDEVPPTAHPFGLVNVFRDDVAETSDEATGFRSLALEGGPEVEDGRFKVPPALGEAP